MSLKYIIVFVCSLLFVNLNAHAQQWHGLYDDRIAGNVTDTMQLAPDKEGYKEPGQPGLQVFKPEAGKANGTALVIFPGGGYSFVSLEGEGSNIGKAFAGRGVTCFVVKYRLPGAQAFAHKETIPLTDAVAAMCWVKKRAAVYQLDTTKIGAIGFSAGGHLAATLANLAPKDARPAFSLLIYPVVSMRPEITHDGSRLELLGKDPSQKLEQRYSAELNINALTPPTYITHPSDDGLVPVENSIRLYQALVKAKIPAELHTPQQGNHGFIFNIPQSEWIDPIMKWLKANNFVTPQIDGKGKTVILTFDDASKSHYSQLPKMLKPYGFGTTFYVCEFPPDFSDSSKYMNWRQIAELSKMGYEIGNHTWRHTGVTGKTAEIIEKEIAYIDQQCKRYGIPKPTSFCYPGYGTDSACIPVLKNLGYTTARTGGDKPWQPTKDRPYYIPAFTITGNNPAYFYKALEQSTTSNAIVFCVHGVPDNAHDWVNTPPEVFETYLKYLHEHHFNVVSMSQYIKSRPVKGHKRR